MNLFIWLIAPIKDLKSFKFCGLSFSFIACTFSFIGLIPSPESLNSSLSVSAFAILHFSSFKRIPALSEALIVASTSLGGLFCYLLSQLGCRR